MNTDDGARVPVTDSGKVADRQIESASAPPVSGRRSGTPIIVGAVVVLLLLGAAAYYFLGHRTGTDVAMRPAPESPPAATATAPAENAKNPAASAAPTQPSPPPAPQQSAGPAPDPTPAPEPSAALPATAVHNGTNVPTPAESKPPAQSAEATPKSEQPSTPAPAAPPPMRDQPAALPDQAAATPPKNETMLVVMRGPANIRSAPGKGGRVVGTVAKNATVKELSRSGKWVEVETNSGTGWIAASLLSPRPSESR